MDKTKLIRVLKTLESREIREFKDFLDSPAFNRRQDLKLLFQSIWPLLHSELLPAKAEVWAQIYPDKDFDRTQFDLLISYLFQLLKAYLIHAAASANPGWEGDLKLLNTFRKKGLQKDFDQLSRRLQTKLDKTKEAGDEFHLAQFNLNYQKQLALSRISPVDDPLLPKMHQHLDAYYYGQKMKLLWIAASQQAVYQYQSDHLQADQILEEIKKRDLLNFPFVAVYYYAYQLVQSPDNDYFFTFYKDYLIEHAANFTAEEIQGLYLAAINHCVRKGNAGQYQFFEEVFELYKVGLQNELLLINEELSRFTYHNIVAAGLYTGNYDWTEIFINEYKKRLAKKYQESSFSFNTARLAYSKREYDVALQLLQRANYRDVLLNLAAKGLLIKIYYENNDWEVLDAHLSALQLYLSRKKVLGYHKANYKNIIKYSRKLIQSNLRNKAVKEKLTMAIREEEILTEKKWMLEQLGQVV